MTTNDEWNRRITAEYDAANLTHLYRVVLQVLPTFRGHGGMIFPSHQAIADRVRLQIRCCVRSVERALIQARKLGLLFWMPQHRRVGWRKIRSSNLYVLNVPAAQVRPGQGPVWRRYHTDRQAGRIQEKQESKTLFMGRVWAPHAPVRTVDEQIAIINGGKYAG